LADYASTKAANKNMLCVMHKSTGKSADCQLTKMENVLRSAILSAKFLHIGHQILFLLLCRLFATKDKCLLQLFIVFVIYFHSLHVEKLMQASLCDLQSAVAIFDIERSSRQQYQPCHDSPIVSTDFLGQLSYAQKSQSTFVDRLTCP